MFGKFPKLARIGNNVNRLENICQIHVLIVTQRTNPCMLAGVCLFVF